MIKGEEEGGVALVTLEPMCSINLVVTDFGLRSYCELSAGTRMLIVGQGPLRFPPYFYTFATLTLQ